MPFMTLVGKADALVKVGRVCEAEELVTTTLAEAAKEGALGYQAELTLRLASIAIPVSRRRRPYKRCRAQRSSHAPPAGTESWRASRSNGPGFYVRRIGRPTRSQRCARHHGVPQHE
jgi:hypothetical protein